MTLAEHRYRCMQAQGSNEAAAGAGCIDANLKDTGGRIPLAACCWSNIDVHILIVVPDRNTILAYLYVVLYLGLLNLLSV